MKETIKVLMVDDHPLVRRGIAACLAQCKNIEIVGETGDPNEVVDLARKLQPEVVLMDIGLPQISGLVITALLHRELPEIKVLILSIHDSPEYMRQAIQAGAQGYLFKGTAPGEIAEAVAILHRGEKYFSPNIVRNTLEQFIRAGADADATHLTKREREVLVQIAEGRSNKEVAAGLGVSVRTVESHREHLMRKLNIHSAAGLARFAMAKGLITVEGGPTATPFC